VNGEVGCSEVTRPFRISERGRELLPLMLCVVNKADHPRQSSGVLALYSPT
jgi:hypothetical protein